MRLSRSSSRVPLNKTLSSRLPEAPAPRQGGRRPVRGVGSCGACRGLAGGDRMGNTSSSAEGGSTGGDGGKRQRDNEEGDVDNLDSKKHRTDPGDEEEHKREEARERARDAQGLPRETVRV